LDASIGSGFKYIHEKFLNESNGREIEKSGNREIEKAIDEGLYRPPALPKKSCPSAALLSFGVPTGMVRVSRCIRDPRIPWHIPPRDRQDSKRPGV
jgi:hypothetical protein